MPVLFVGNLPDDIKSKEVEDMFYKFGRIESVNVRSKGKDTFAFVEFAHDSDAQEALRRRDGYQFDSRHRVRVEFSRGKGDRNDRNDRNDDYDRRDRRDDYGRRDDYDNRRDRDYGRDSRYGNDRYGRSDNKGRPQRRERPAARINESLYKVIVDNMPEGVSWQDLKDFFKKNAGPDVKFTEVKDGQGIAGFETKEQALSAIEGMNKTVLRNKNDEESTVSMTLAEPSSGNNDTPQAEEGNNHNMDLQEERERSRDSPRYD